jgi:YggT family protein
MRALLDVILLVLYMYQYVVIAAVVLSWLIGFGVVNMHNDVVRAIYRGVAALTDPLLRPIQRILPSMGGLDLSPLILLLAIYFVQHLIEYNIYPMAIGY